MFEGEELTPEVIAKYMQTPEGALELQQIMVEMEQYQGPGIGDTDLTGSMDVPTGGEIGQIDTDQLWNSEAAPNIPDATRGLPPEPIGASPNIPGATLGSSSGIGGILPEEENRRRMRGVLSGQGLGY